MEWETVFVLLFFVLLGFSCSAFAFGRDRYRNARLEFLIKRMRVLQLRLFCSKLGKANERVYLSLYSPLTETESDERVVVVSRYH